MTKPIREDQAPLLKKAEGPAEKFCFDCTYFLRGSGECVHPKVTEAWKTVWGGHKGPPQSAARIDAGLMRLFWCSIRGVFWQRRTAEQVEVDERGASIITRP